MAHPYNKRLMKEFRSLSGSSLHGIEVLEESTITEYAVEIQVDNPIYVGQKFLLSVIIGNSYPVDSPLVQFLSRDTYSIPVHPHIYTNGHICLNVLGQDWTPACSVETVLLSVQSMLSTNTELQLPPDNDKYVAHAPKDPKKGNFVYHDDTV